jgi:hypothetical protein
VTDGFLRPSGCAGPDPAESQEAQHAFWLWRCEQYGRRGREFPSKVVRNPGPGWLLQAAAESRGDGLRGLFQGDDLVWWHPDLGVTHGEALRWLGLLGDAPPGPLGDAPWRALEVEFHLIYKNRRSRSGRAVGSFFTAKTERSLGRLLAHPSVAPHLGGAGGGLKV